MPTTLNPLAPEYTPIPPGITNPHHALPFPFPPPSSGVVHHHLLPPPPATTLFPSQFYTYVSSTSCKSVLPYHTTTYYVSPQNPTPPPPAQEVVSGFGSGQRGQRGGFRATGRGRGSVIEKRQRILRPICNEQKILGFQREEKNRHGIMPLKWDEEKTTVMIKNIPYDCPRKELIKMLDDFCMIVNAKESEEGTSRRRTKELVLSAYDFLYLPVDFRTRKSRGFAFVNFTNAKAVRKFFNAFNLATWDLLRWKNWTKSIEIVTAKIQGKDDLVRHFSGSMFECESDDFLPVTFSPARDGSGQPVQMTIVGHRRAVYRGGARK